MNVMINGKPFELTGPLSIAELLQQREWSGKHLAVELNGEVVPRAQHPERTLEDGDELEVVSLVGGG